MGNLLKRAFSKIHNINTRFSIVRNKFWFVDIPRTSSSSIRSELGKRFGKSHGKYNVTESIHATAQFFPDHTPARKMRALLGGSIWDSIFTFTIVRNPWDRIYSMYHYRKDVLKDIPREWSLRDYVLALGNSFSKTNKFFKYHAFRYGASEYILGENGEMIVDFIAKYENRLLDIGLIASHLNFTGLGKLHIQGAMPKNKHYSEFFDLETKEIIRKLYAKDIELFDYEFEDKT